MKRILIILVSALLIPAILSAKEPAKPITADTIQVLKIAAQDERAVIKTPDGKTRIIKPGDVLSNDLKVMEISAGRVVMSEGKGRAAETIIIRLENGKQTIERIKPGVQPQPALYAPRPVARDKNEQKTR